MTVARHFDIGGDLRVDRIGYGAMRLTGQPGNFGPYADHAAGIELLTTAQSLGVTFFDGARAYGPRHCDQLLGEALGDAPVILATKCGLEKPAPDKIERAGSPDAIKRHVADAQEDLRRPVIDLMQLHRVDPAVPLERTIEAIARAQADGAVRHIGLSNVTRSELDRALAVAPIASVQNRLNMDEPDADDLVDYTASKGIAFIPYGPLGANPMRPGARLNPAEALRWLLKRSPNIIAIPGTTSIAHLRENWTVWDTVDDGRAQGG